MKICVLMKQVPDKNASLKIAADNCSLMNENITLACNESDNYALEEALLIKEQHGGEVVACTLGQQTAPQILKDAMAKGADRSIFISDEKFEKLDILSIGKVFVSALKNENFDLILSGLQSDDHGNSQLGLILSELLNMSHASLVMGTEILNDNTIKVKRELENGWFQWSELSLPSSISIQSGINTPRYATLKGIMMVKNKTTDTFNAQDLNMEHMNAHTNLENLYVPQKSKETQFIDGTTDEVVEKLVDVLKNEIKVMN
ncbi:MAG: electron transfer flavoprotein subunit beta/FixA family protein [Candidatus Neomarinimicrobiota bacterium]|nr:electron transfer flavoprotein subunit beta/FixA family protein [Candidatus Neomarinimicrobiota bacterium]